MTSEAYVPLAGSERAPMAQSRKLGPADPNEEIEVTVMVRAKQKLADAPPLPEGTYMTHEEFERSFGATSADLTAVEDFARRNNLTVIEQSPAQRTIQLRGSVGAFSKAFHVDLNEYEYPDGRYRGREGAINIPESLNGVIEGVFGLDNRPAAQPRS